MPLVYSFFYNRLELDLSIARRVCRFLPGSTFLFLTAMIFWFPQSITTIRFEITILGKTKRAGFFDYVRIVSDFRVSLMTFWYSTGFGGELVMNNILASYGEDVFGVSLVAADALALCFGPRDPFAPSVGVIVSDWENQRSGKQGRLWPHFVALFGRAFSISCLTAPTRTLGLGRSPWLCL